MAAAEAVQLSSESTAVHPLHHGGRVRGLVARAPSTSGQVRMMLPPPLAILHRSIFCLLYFDFSTSLNFESGRFSR